MKKILLVIALTLAIVLPSLALADGGIISRPGYWMYETGQKAVIVFEKNTETLIISTTFEGDAKDFAWILPTPSQPKVTKAPYNLFDSLDKLTQEEIRYGGGMMLMSSKEVSAPASGVTVLEQKKIDIYDITVLSATDKNALYDWLKENEYFYPASSKYILDDYIRNNWIFTAVKINTDSMDIASDQLRRGTANPLKLVFSTDKIVYPLKISAVTSSAAVEPTGKILQTETTTTPAETPAAPAATKVQIMPSPPRPYDNWVPIKLYVFADHKKDAIGFTAEWANWVKADKIKNLAFDETGNPWYEASGTMYLTKLSRSMQTSEMKDDVFLVNAKSNSSIPPSNFWPIMLWVVLSIFVYLILPPTLLYVIFMLLFIFVKSKTAKIIFLVIQSLLAVGLGTTILIMYLLNPPYGTQDLPPSLGFLIGAGFMSLLMILGIILEIIKARRKQLL